MKYQVKYEGRGGHVVHLGSGKHRRAVEFKPNSAEEFSPEEFKEFEMATAHDRPGTWSIKRIK